MLKKDLFKLRTGLERLVCTPDAALADSVFILPLSPENASNMLILGDNTAITKKMEMPLKFLL